jgi:protein TonB
MFEQSVMVGAARTRRAWTVPVSFAGQVGVVGLLVLMPFVFVERLPRMQIMPLPLTAPGAYVPEPPPGKFVKLVGTSTDSTPRPFVAPTRVPVGVAKVADPVGPPIVMQPACVGLCVPGGIPDALPALTTQRAIPQAPPVVRHVEPVVRPVVQPQTERVRISQGLQEAKLIHRVVPVYPRLAVIARVSGDVHLAAIIGADGRVRELRIVSGHPLLAQAALDAVRQWAYQPTMLSGAPVEVATDITVTFRLTGY